MPKGKPKHEDEVAKRLAAPRKKSDPKTVREYLEAKATMQGRPTVYHPAFDAMAMKFCLLGATDEELGRSFEVAESTVQRWMEEYPSFRGSVKEGRGIADANVASSLYHRANGYSHPAEKIFVLKVDGVSEDADGKSVRTQEIVEHRAQYTERFPPSDAAAIFWLKNRRRDLWRDNPQVVIQNNTQVVTPGNSDPVQIGQSYRSIVDDSE